MLPCLVLSTASFVDAFALFVHVGDTGIVCGNGRALLLPLPSTGHSDYLGLERAQASLLTLSSHLRCSRVLFIHWWRWLSPCMYVLYQFMYMSGTSMVMIYSISVGFHIELKTNIYVDTWSRLDYIPSGHTYFFWQLRSDKQLVWLCYQNDFQFLKPVRVTLQTALILRIVMTSNL